jgi:hypothetical protein
MNWSEKYYESLNDEQHKINNDWFKNMLRYLKDNGILYVPNIQKSFNKKGKEVA